MTHGREKSDSSIVPGKPVSNVVRATAEVLGLDPRMEGRGEAEGNTGTPTHAPGAEPGERVQGLDRVRQAARRRR